MNKVVNSIRQELFDQADPVKAEFLPRFFVLEPGDKDEFLGITVPKQRLIVNKYYSELSPVDVLDLLRSKVHEERLTALLIWVRQYERGDEPTKKEIYDLYLKNTKWVNSWDLVDSTAYKIAGNYLLDRDRGVLDKFSKSKNMWERRIAIVSTLAFIKQDDFVWTLSLAEQYLSDQHHYIQKATGWMLREMGKKDPHTLTQFLDKFAAIMPRTMLRYSIEKLTAQQRQHYLKQKTAT